MGSHASKSVRKHFETLTDQLARFRAAQFGAELHHNAIRNSDPPAADDAQAIAQRMELGAMAEAIGATYHELEAAIRKDVRP